MTLKYLELYTLGIKKLGQFLSRTYLLTYLKKDTPNLLEVINIGTSP